jgi:hypothetical protein
VEEADVPPISERANVVAGVAGVFAAWPACRLDDIGPALQWSGGDRGRGGRRRHGRPEAADEEVRGDVAFAQAVMETGGFASAPDNDCSAKVLNVCNQMIAYASGH